MKNELLLWLANNPCLMMDESRVWMLKSMLELEGDTLPPLAKESRKSAESTGKTAYIPMLGVITNRATALDDFFGDVSTDSIGAAFDSAMNNPEIDSILFDIDSPGGGVYGVHELSEKIFNARGQKPIFAVSNSLMASAAYYIGSAADRLYVTPSGEIGSIGVVAIHQDITKMAENFGVKFTIIRAGKHKFEGSPYESLNEESLGYLQSRVNDYYDMFIESVARNRKTSKVNVRDNYGEGRVMGAEQAVKVGMADRIGTLHRALVDLAVKVGRRKTRNQAVMEKINTDMAAAGIC